MMIYNKNDQNYQLCSGKATAHDIHELHTKWNISWYIEKVLPHSSLKKEKNTVLQIIDQFHFYQFHMW